MFAFLLTLVKIVQATQSFPYPNFEYDPMKEEVVLFFGAPDPSNKAIIEVIASNNSNLITWIDAGQRESENSFLHPIGITNEIGQHFVNCLFLTPNNSTLVTDFYMERMMRSLKSAKIVLLAPLDTLQPKNDGFLHLLEWFTLSIQNATEFLNSTMLIVTGNGKNETGPDMIFKLLSDYTQQLNGSVKEVATGLLSSTKIGSSGQIPATIASLNEIPSTTMLPTDVNLSTERNTTAIDAVSYYLTIFNSLNIKIKLELIY